MKTSGTGCLRAGACVMMLVWTTAASAQSVSFEPPRQYATTASRPTVATGDFNGDGRVDIAVGSAVETQVQLFLGDGQGGFSAPMSYAVPGASTLVAIDINADGKLDLYAATNNAAQVLFGNGAGGFSAGISTRPGVLLADFTNDGIPDLISLGSLAPSCLMCHSINLNTGLGDGTFGEPRIVDGQEDFFVVLAAADFNGDGFLDLLYDGSPRVLKVAQNNGDGSLAPKSSVFTEVSGEKAAVGDFNGDGKIDVVKTNAFVPGYAEFTMGDPALELIAGLTSTLTGGDPAEIDFGLRCQGGGFAEVREHGAYKADVSFKAGDVFRISVSNGIVSYAINGMVFYGSSIQATGDLYFGVLFATIGSEISAVTVQ